METGYFKDLIEIAPYVDDFLDYSSEEDVGEDRGKFFLSLSYSFIIFPPLIYFRYFFR